MNNASQRRHIDTILSYGGHQTTNKSYSPTHELIGRSWQRCLTEYGLDPSQPRPARIVTHQTLREHQDSVDEFLNVARAGVEQLYTQISGLGYVLLLSDHRGITVQFLGNKHDDDRLHKAGLYLGADWSEQYAGTSAVGTCIQEQQALTCHRVDHFDSSHIGLTCTAAPIKDPSGQLLAVLDISALNSSRTPESQNFALHLTQLYARLIEDAYFLRRYRHSLIFKCDQSRELVQVNGQLLFALDEQGNILAANTAGRALLAQYQPISKDSISLPDLLACQWRDILSITYESKDGVRAFRVSCTQQMLYGILIEPRTKTSSQLNVSDVIASQDESVPPLDKLCADDPAMRQTISLAKRLRHRDVSLLILGETGTGKEVLAKAIHATSHRSDQPFMAVNCAAIPESLIESELFGYAPGTFTGGRVKGAKGLIQEANGGTLFLDEIGDMPLQLQSRLLRVLAEGQVLPLGASQPVNIDIRVLAATHCNLTQLITDGLFREDLYYRLNGETLKLPALKARVDKHYLIKLLLKRINPAARLRADAMSALLAYAWPGNIRQLVNTLTFAEAICKEGEITVYHLPEECIAGRLDKPTFALPMQVLNPSYTATLSPETLSDPLLEKADAKSEQQILINMLRQQRWNISAVAKQSGISRPTVYRRMKKLGIRLPRDV
ncbi:sigma-54-dependent Fis family transcriptional regulator [Amphritea sp. 2_MG-2023]|uniref:sigma-54-dependent Fis family transcriptional regulator n=1 Tax=Amphritea TaxID=515417 RepID=UPI001C07C8E8|nr:MULTISPECIES: sigma-54-dependent Fis family transcriptional regulator [Amphritea]MBU2965607.1 sigma-54-dependent Fis family transcriptional regulator [Amphritea atlantica]MDO6418762.1 sigma-54-dependent Fis family transcriptional regulator [Amphritea sp. 2_MG-2023]